MDWYFFLSIKCLGRTLKVISFFIEGASKAPFMHAKLQLSSWILQFEFNEHFITLLSLPFTPFLKKEE